MLLSTSFTKSKIAYFICLLCIIATAFFYPRWEKHGGESALGWDVSGYYWYLPSVFIYHDLKGQHFKDSVLQQYPLTGTDFQQGMALEDGGYVMKYASGMAILYSPFFFMAHLIALMTHYPADGFSLPYQMAIAWGSILVSFIGLYYLRKLLLRYYSDGVVALTLLLLVIGSNYLNYAAIDNGQTHNWLFTVYVFLLLATDNYYRRFQLKYAIAIGLLCGLLTLCRPTEIISLLIPLLWGLNKVSIRSFKERINTIWQQRSHYIIAASCFLAVASIQLIYWKIVSGHWLVYSYGDQGFYWTRPYVYNYAISIRSGWITYTPLAAFFIIGIIPFIKYGTHKLAILCFFVLNFYLVSAWDIWWYAGTGGRAMIQSYPVLLFILASFLSWMLQRKWAKIIFIPILLFSVYINIWFTIQAHGGRGLYDSEVMMHRPYFNHVYGHWNPDEQVIKLKDVPEIFTGTPKQPQLIYQDQETVCLPDSSAETFRTLALNSWKDSFHWLRFEAHYSIGQKEWNVWKMTTLIVQFKHQDKDIKTVALRLQRMMNEGSAQRIFFDVKKPEEKFDTINYRWNNNGSELRICIDSFSVTQFKE